MTNFRLNTNNFSYYFAHNRNPNIDNIWLNELMRMQYNETLLHILQVSNG
jgi:hypothetical protein